MSQLMTLSPATSTSTTACPAWCTETAHFEDSPHFGGMFDINLSIPDPTYMVTMDGPAVVSDCLTVALFQAADGDTPVIGLSYDPACADTPELPDMTLDEAESLGRALLDLVRRGRAAA